ncbi:MAG: prepilin-type N-terminal cleavage/methylation domain-containing protein [Rubrivivax sp.]|nr:prepilin-type N-terminal cleavage/methylation domain-containing protein [Rubrivivax sp.]
MMRQRGFSLIEMVISIALVGVIAVMATPLMRLPLAAWADASRRADLVQAAQAANAQLAQDLQRALPGSVRLRTLGPRVLVEMLDVRAQGRYRGGSGGAGVCPVACAAPASRDALLPGCADGCFTSLGALEGDPPVPALDWLVVLAAPASDPYLGGNVAVPGGVKSRLIDVVAAPEGQRVRFAAHNFAAGSPQRRFYLVAGPVTWDCDPVAGTLRRIAGYPIAAVQPINPVGATSNAVVADGITACQWQLQPAAGALGGTLLARLQLQRAAAGGAEVERLEHQAQFALAQWR